MLQGMGEDDQGFDGYGEEQEEGLDDDQLGMGEDDDQMDMGEDEPLLIDEAQFMQMSESQQQAYIR